MACKSADATAIALGAEAVVSDVVADLHEQINVVGKSTLIQVKYAVSKDAADPVSAVVAQTP